MAKRLSKSEFKPRALQDMREVQETGRELVITDRGEPVLKIVPYRSDPERALQVLRGTVVHYDDPTEPVVVDLWRTSRTRTRPTGWSWLPLSTWMRRL